MCTPTLTNSTTENDMIPRSMALLGCALALALAAPLGNQADAQSQYRFKRCIAPAMHGAPRTWVCRATEICCYDWLLRRGTCPTGRCF
jgi:hypothetical protein